MNDLYLHSLETAAVKSRSDFIEFLNKLLLDYQKTGKNWENQNLGDFLEALVSYAADVDGYYCNLAKAGREKVDADTASWRVFADMLRGATVYE